MGWEVPLQRSISWDTVCTGDSPSPRLYPMSLCHHQRCPFLSSHAHHFIHPANNSRVLWSWKKLSISSLSSTYIKLFHYAGPSHSLAPWGILNSPLLAGLSVPTHSPLHFKTPQQPEPCFGNPLLKAGQQFPIALHQKSKVLHWP